MLASLGTISLWLLLSLRVGFVATKAPLKVRAQTKPAPVVVPSSQDFKGDDGPWSTFTLQIGSPPQDVEVQISTASYQTIVVLPGGCTSSDPSTCPSDRGNVFNPNSSSSWKANTVVPNSTFTLNLDTNLGYNENGLYGYDDIQLGWQGSGGPSLTQQIVAGIETKDFFLGFFGLNPRPTNFTTFNSPVASFLTAMQQSNEIPSLSWGYTAGNQYRPGSVLGSLTLGGFDKGRFIPNSVTFPFNSVDARDLTVMIKSIESKTTRGPALAWAGSSGNTAAFIDSTTPYLWLPLDACQAFEKAFGLTWNNSVQAYLVNDTLHTALQQQNANITFNLATPNGTETVAITLPYGAFDLNADYPLLSNASRYFPLQRAMNDTQYTLGRAFLQEAYLIADYERRNFSVNQCQYPLNPEDITPIKSIADEIREASHGLSHGAIAGIVIGVIVALALLVLLGVCLWKRRARLLSRNQHPAMTELDGDGSSLSGDFKKHSGLHEVDGNDLPVNEIDGVKLSGHEMDGHEYGGHELGSDEYRFELDSGRDAKYEMPALEPPANELLSPPAKLPEELRSSQRREEGHLSSIASEDVP